MDKRILITGEGYTDEHFRRLGSLGFEILHHVEISPERLKALLPTIDVHILGGSETLDDEAIESADRLRLISFAGTGYSAFVNESAARKRGIKIANTPGVNAPAVAEHTIGLLIGLARGLFGQNEAIKRVGGTPTNTVELATMTIGIVGMGAIGLRVAKILRTAFGCRLIYSTRTRKPEIESLLELKFVGLDELFQTADAALLLIPTTPETTNLVDESRLDGAKPGLLLVNTAGAKLVQPEALKRSLNNGRVAAAAFDGYWIEPLPTPAEDPFGLLSLPDARFVVTPHTAAKTTDAWKRMVELAVENVITAFDPDAK
jgi:glyoxylate reductase